MRITNKTYSDLVKAENMFKNLAKRMEWDERFVYELAIIEDILTNIDKVACSLIRERYKIESIKI